MKGFKMNKIFEYKGVSFFLKNERYFISKNDMFLDLKSDDRALTCFLPCLEMKVEKFLEKLSIKSYTELYDLIDINKLLKYVVDMGSEYWIVHLLEWMIVIPNINDKSIFILRKMLSNKNHSQHVRVLIKKIIK
jgi:hypothetical protein